MNASLKRRLPQLGYLAAQLAVIIPVGVCTGEVWYTVLTACLGVLYTGLTAAGNRFGFCVAWVYVLLYAYTSWTEQLYATAVFLAVFLFPMMIFSFISWSRNRQGGNVSARALSWKKRGILAAVTAVFVAGLTAVLYFVKSAQPFNDAIFFAVSAIAAVLILLRYCEMWWMSLLSNIVGCIMWAIAVGQGSAQWCILCLNVFSLFNSVYGIVTWMRMRRAQTESPSGKEHKETPPPAAGAENKEEL